MEQEARNEIVMAILVSGALQALATRNQEIDTDTQGQRTMDTALYVARALFKKIQQPTR
jgi:hypothetical protein